jgi:hypothetical protein
MAERSVFIRISTKDADKAVAELRKVGVRGEKSLERIQRAAKPASLGLVAVDRSVGLVNRQFAVMAGRVAAVVAPAAMGALVRRAIETADELGKTAARVGFTTDALQELRFAASQSGVDQAKLDTSLERFTKRLGEASQGLGGAVQWFERLGVATRDSDGNVRDASEAFDEVAIKMAAIPTHAERAAAAAAFFGREGVGLINVLRDGADGLERMRKQARDLGVVMEERTIRGAEELNDRLDQLARIIGTNFQAGLLDAFVGSLDDFRAIVTDPALRESARELGTFVGNVVRLMIENRAEIAAFVAALGALKVSGAIVSRLPLPAQLKALIPLLSAGAAGIATYSAAQRDAAEDTDVLSGSVDELRERLARARDVLKDFQSLSGEALAQKFGDELPSFDLTRPEDRAKGIRIIEDRIRDFQAAIAGLEKTKPKPIILPPPEDKGAARAANKNRELVESLEAEIDALSRTERQRSIDTALRRLSADATDVQRQQVAELAGQLFDESQAQEQANAVRERAKAIFDETRTPAEQYAATIAELEDLLAAGTISQDTFGRAVAQAKDELTATTEQTDALKDAFSDASRAISSAFEDALVEGQGFRELLAGLEQDLLRIGTRTLVTKPFEAFLEGILNDGAGGGGIGGGAGGSGDFLGSLISGAGSILASYLHEVGVVGTGATPKRSVPVTAFSGAPRLHDGLGPDEFAAILRRGEAVVPLSGGRSIPVEMRGGETGGNVVNNVTINVSSENPDAFRRSLGQLTLEAKRAMDRAAQRNG